MKRKHGNQKWSVVLSATALVVAALGSVGVAQAVHRAGEDAAFSARKLCQNGKNCRGAGAIKVSKKPRANHLVPLARNKKFPGSVIPKVASAKFADSAGTATRATSAASADRANTATTAGTATRANTANSANTATSATNAANANKLNGLAANQIAPVLRAQQDAGGSGSSVSGTRQVNSVSVAAPTSGVLMISGNVYVNNFTASVVDYVLRPKVDGVSATPAGWLAYYAASPSGQAGSRFTLSYTVSHPVSAGTHTVTQDLGEFNNGNVSYFYNNNELTVLFVPQASVASLTTTTAAGSTNGK